MNFEREQDEDGEKQRVREQILKLWKEEEIDPDRVTTDMTGFFSEKLAEDPELVRTVLGEMTRDRDRTQEIVASQDKTD